MAPLSEYRRKFRRKGEASQQDYVIRYNYMVGRRSTEMSHTPIDWDVASDTDSEVSSSRSNLVESSRKKKTLAEHATQTPDKDGAKDWRESRAVLCSDAAVQCEKNKAEPGVGKRGEKEQEKSNKSSKQNEKKSVKMKTVEVKAPRDKKGRNCEATIKTKAPLIPYGWAYRGPIDNHKTFNVKVPEKEASESALRALKRRQLDIQRKEEEKRQQALQRKNTEALFDLVEKDKSGWLSEYQRNFSGYKYNF